MCLSKAMTWISNVVCHGLFFLFIDFRWEGIVHLFVCLMVFNATFNNISVLLVEKTTNLSQVADKFYHIMLYTSSWSRFELTTSVVIGTDCMGSCKSNYRTIKIMTAPSFCWYWWNCWPSPFKLSIHNESKGICN